MFKHCVMMRFNEQATEEQRQAAIDAVSTLPSKIPEIVLLTAGLDAGLRDDNFDLAVVVDFDAKSDYEVYAGHPDHIEVIQQYLAPVLEQRVAVQFEY